MSDVAPISIGRQEPISRPALAMAPATPEQPSAAADEQPVDRYEPTSTEEDDGFSQMCELRQMATTREAESGSQTCSNGFDYDPVQIERLDDAKQWTPGSSNLSGTDANNHINDTYDKLDKDMTRYLGEPRVANWMTFGKYASREAGEQIRNLENVEKAENLDTAAAGDAFKGMADSQPLGQAARLVGHKVAENAARQIDTAVDGDLVGAVTNTVKDTASGTFDTLHTMRDALVEGNTEIYKNIAPAYDAFLSGEADPGKGGMQALKDAGYSKGSEKDPQGFVTQAFERYSQARQKGLEAEQTSDPAARQQLLDERKHLMNEANLNIGLQEQMTILQRPSIYGNPQMQDALGAIGGTMSLTDANGKHDLRPDGKNWSGFADRMGLRPAEDGDPNGIAVRDHHGVTTTWVPDPSQKGTIYEYFTQNVDGPAAERLTEGSPRPL